MQKNTISPEVLAGATALLTPYFQGLTAESLVQKLKKEPISDKTDRLVSMSETAKYLGVSLMTVHRLIKSGTLSKIKVSKRLVKIRESSIQGFLKGGVE